MDKIYHDRRLTKIQSRLRNLLYSRFREDDQKCLHQFEVVMENAEKLLEASNENEKHRLYQIFVDSSRELDY